MSKPRRRTLSHAEIENFLVEIGTGAPKSQVQISNLSNPSALQQNIPALLSASLSLSKDKEKIKNRRQTLDSLPINSDLSFRLSGSVMNIEKNLPYVANPATNLSNATDDAKLIREYCKQKFRLNVSNRGKTEDNVRALSRVVHDKTKYKLTSHRLMRPEEYSHPIGSAEAKRSLLLSLSPMLTEAEEQRKKDTQECEQFTRCRHTKGKVRSTYEYIDIDKSITVEFGEYEKRYMKFIYRNRKPIIKVKKSTIKSSSKESISVSDKMDVEIVIDDFDKENVSSVINTVEAEANILINNRASDRKRKHGQATERRNTLSPASVKQMLLASLEEESREKTNHVVTTQNNTPAPMTEDSLSELCLQDSDDLKHLQKSRRKMAGIGLEVQRRNTLSPSAAKNIALEILQEEVTGLPSQFVQELVMTIDPVEDKQSQSIDACESAFESDLLLSMDDFLPCSSEEDLLDFNAPVEIQTEDPERTDDVTESFIIDVAGESAGIVNPMQTSESFGALELDLLEDTCFQIESDVSPIDGFGEDMATGSANDMLCHEDQNLLIFEEVPASLESPIDSIDSEELLESYDADQISEEEAFAPKDSTSFHTSTVCYNISTSTTSTAVVAVDVHTTSTTAVVADDDDLLLLGADIISSESIAEESESVPASEIDDILDCSEKISSEEDDDAYVFEIETASIDSEPHVVSSEVDYHGLESVDNMKASIAEEKQQEELFVEVTANESEELEEILGFCEESKQSFESPQKVNRLLEGDLLCDGGSGSGSSPGTLLRSPTLAFSNFFGRKSDADILQNALRIMMDDKPDIETFELLETLVTESLTRKNRRAESPGMDISDKEEALSEEDKPKLSSFEGDQLIQTSKSPVSSPVSKKQEEMKEEQKESANTSSARKDHLAGLSMIVDYLEGESNQMASKVLSASMEPASSSMPSKQKGEGEEEVDGDADLPVHMDEEAAEQRAHARMRERFAVARCKYLWEVVSVQAANKAIRLSSARKSDSDLLSSFDKR